MRLTTESRYALDALLPPGCAIAVVRLMQCCYDCFGGVVDPSHTAVGDPGGSDRGQIRRVGSGVFDQQVRQYQYTNSMAWLYLSMAIGNNHLHPDQSIMRNHQLDGRYALIVCVHNGSAALVSKLLDANADPNLGTVCLNIHARFKLDRYVFVVDTSSLLNGHWLLE
jgi:hypothetical protein